MRNLMVIAILSMGIISLSSFKDNSVSITSMYAEKFDIKIKNDTD
ncbi:hypothetical protein [Cloacibacterium sp.]